MNLSIQGINKSKSKKFKVYIKEVSSKKTYQNKKENFKIQVFFKIKEDIWDWDFISSKGYCLKTENNGEANLRKYKDIINTFYNT